MTTTIAASDALAASAASLVVGQSLTICLALLLLPWSGAASDAKESSRRWRLGLPTKGAQANPRFWLALAVCASGLQSLGDYLLHLGQLRAAYWISPLASAGLLIIGPALWQYAKSITQEIPGERAGRGGSLAHFLPALLLITVMAIGVALEPWAPQEAPAKRSTEELIVLLSIAIHMLIYLSMIPVRINSVEPILADNYSSLEGRTLTWLKSSALIFLLIVLVWVCTWPLDVATSNTATNALLASAVFVIGFNGVRQSRLFKSEALISAEAGSDEESGGFGRTLALLLPGSPPEGAVEVNVQTGSSAPALDAVAMQATERGKYYKSGIPSDRREEVIDRLHAVMQREKPYLESDLSLQDLAELVEVSPHQLSQVLSQSIGKTFFDYVNGLRVAAVMRMLSSPVHAGRSVLDIGFDCGFGSKSSFNEAFKRAAGMTPTQYRKGLPATSAALDLVLGEGGAADREEAPAA